MDGVEMVAQLMAISATSEGMGRAATLRLIKMNPTICKFGAGRECSRSYKSLCDRSAE